VVIDPLGSQLFDISLESLDSGGRVIVFGVLTGEESKLNLGSLYRREFEVIGSTGGSRRELKEIIELASKGKLKVKVWRKYSLEEASKAIKELRDESREGRILIKPRWEQ